LDLLFCQEFFERFDKKCENSAGWEPTQHQLDINQLRIGGVHPEGLIAPQRLKKGKEPITFERTVRFTIA
jgi:hypothetical protein